MAVDQPGEGPIRALPLMGDREQIVVLGKDDAPELSGSLQQALVVPRCGPIIPTGQYVQPAPAEPFGDSGIHMMIHVEVNTHGSKPRSRSLRRPGDSAAPARRIAMRSCRVSISPSIASLWS